MLFLTIILISCSSNSENKVNNNRSGYLYELALVDSVRITDRILLLHFRKEPHDKPYIQFVVEDSAYPYVEATNAFSGFFNTNVDKIREDHSWFIINNQVPNTLINTPFIISESDCNKRKEMIQKILRSYVFFLFRKADVVSNFKDSLGVIDNSYEINLDAGEFRNKFLVRDLCEVDINNRINVIHLISKNRNFP